MYLNLSGHTYEITLMLMSMLSVLRTVQILKPFWTPSKSRVRLFITVSLVLRTLVYLVLYIYFRGIICSTVPLTKEMITPKAVATVVYEATATFLPVMIILISNIILTVLLAMKAQRIRSTNKNKNFKDAARTTILVTSIYVIFITPSFTLDMVLQFPGIFSPNMIRYTRENFAFFTSGISIVNTFIYIWRIDSFRLCINSLIAKIK